MTTAFKPPVEPLRRIVEDRYNHRDGGTLVLECGHQKNKEIGKKYGKSTRCWRCVQVPKIIEALEQIQVNVPTAKSRLWEGKLAEETVTWSVMFDFCRRLKKSLDDLNGA